MMQTKNYHKLTLLVCLIAVALDFVLSDEFVDIKKDKSKKNAKNEDQTKIDKKTKPAVDKSAKAKIITQYFENEGIFIGVEPDAEFIGRYDEDMVTKMSEIVAQDDYLKASEMETKLNSLIFSKMLKTVNPKTLKSPYELADEALFQALDLIVPSSPTEPELDLAKKELRKFFEEHTDLCHELLDRISYLLDAQELHTHKAVEFLLGSYYNWIPLGRLGEFIDKNGESN